MNPVGDEVQPGRQSVSSPSDEDINHRLGLLCIFTSKLLTGDGGRTFWEDYNF